MITFQVSSEPVSLGCNLPEDSFFLPKFAAVQSLSCVRLFATPWIAACQAFLFFTISQSLLKLLFVESAMPPRHHILCCPFLLLPSVLPSIRVFFNESALCIRWPKYWHFSFSISPSNKGLPLGLTSLICFCFISYAKAFDCVDHNELWKILKEMRISDYLTCLLRNLYAGQEATVRTGYRTTD